MRRSRERANTQKRMTRSPRLDSKAPGTFDPFRMSGERGAIAGSLDVAHSDRLADRVAEGTGIVTWRIEGTTDAAGRPALEISVSGRVPLECQRCLAVFDMPLDQRTLMLLAKSEADADALDAGSDDEVLVADRALDPVALVEDELLLALPYAPMHAEGECERTDAATGNP